MKKIVFLYSQENFVWTSMEEIIPYIRQLWSDYIASHDGYELLIISVDEDKPTKYLKELLLSDLIVISCFNTPMAQWMRIIREKMNIQSPWFFYLHNQATIGLWPLFELGVGKYLTQRDRFIGTCIGDRLSMQLCFDKPRVFVHPFSKKGLKTIPTALSTQKASDIIFIGRLSRQKNLESLIQAFSKLSATSSSSSELKLHFYGKEDQLGWPNMGIKPQESYLVELEALAKKLGISERVLFHGFVKREDIQQKWETKPFVFCSPSLHSDENFGMAALMALEMGGRLVLTRWGGHCNYIENLPNCVYGINVYHDGIQLHTKLDELTQALDFALEKRKISKETEFFSYKQALSHLDRIFDNSANDSRNKLKLSTFGQQLLDQREYYHDKKKAAEQVFADEGDPIARELFKCYGAKE